MFFSVSGCTVPSYMVNSGFVVHLPSRFSPNPTHPVEQLQPATFKVIPKLDDYDDKENAAEMKKSTQLV